MCPTPVDVSIRQQKTRFECLFLTSAVSVGKTCETALWARRGRYHPPLLICKCTGLKYPAHPDGPDVHFSRGEALIPAESPHFSEEDQAVRVAAVVVNWYSGRGQG